MVTEPEMKGDSMKTRRFYLIGDPVKRNKLNSTLRVIGMSLVLGFACIGFGAVLMTVVQILAWR